MREEKDNKKVVVRGEITAKFYDQSELSWFEKKWNEALIAMRQISPKVMKHYRLGKLKAVDHNVNVICNAGFNAITRLLTGDTTYSGEINKALLGTGATGSAAASDTTLETET